MKYADINKRFTEIVAEYIANGYTINTDTMGGCQSGSLANVDLTDGKELIRVFVETKSVWDDFDACKENGMEWFAYDEVSVVAGRCTDNVRINKRKNDIVWNHHLEIISCDTFYKIGGYHSDFYGTKEDSQNQQRKSRERHKNEKYETRKEKVFPAYANAIVLPFMKRQKGCKTIKLSDIERVIKEEYEGKKTYYVCAKKRRYKIA